ncbi:Valacyclovir hydrolase [Paragonimus skrjabini miyazakii]|uniref:Valacyclovir hydrolase n=1 Tax=Paragonimus skrjabini miyazakii TaxID=59628 RepID=A0A8S9YMD1_9TREM|nr:Valacyclovir hydrolase [Paragonimus skrjabini miyazakii]
MLSWNVPNKMHPCGLFESVKGVRIHYIRVGTGEHNLLLFPGPMGDARVDYSTFIELLDTKRFTAVAWDPPGQGASIPPMERPWTKPGLLQNDADIALHLMRQLNLIPYSLLGWSEGAVTALMTVSIGESKVVLTTGPYCPEFRKLFLWAYDGAVSSVPQLGENIDHWPKTSRAPLEAIYGTRYLAGCWKEYTLAKRSNLLLNNVNTQAIRGRLNEQIDQGNGLSIFVMRAPGQLDTENWLTYLLTRFENVVVVNWIPSYKAATVEDNCCLWGPHRANAKEFQTLVEGFLTEDKAVTKK